MAEKRVAIVTGSSSGIGASTARELASRGWNVVINYSKSADAAKKVAAECSAKGGEAIAVQADVSVDAECRKLAQAALEALQSGIVARHNQERDIRAPAQTRQDYRSGEGAENEDDPTDAHDLSPAESQHQSGRIDVLRPSV